MFSRKLFKFDDKIFNLKKYTFPFVMLRRIPLNIVIRKLISYEKLGNYLITIRSG